MKRVRRCFRLGQDAFPEPKNGVWPLAYHSLPEQIPDLWMKFGLEELIEGVGSASSYRLKSPGTLPTRVLSFPDNCCIQMEVEWGAEKILAFFDCIFGFTIKILSKIHTGDGRNAFPIHHGLKQKGGILADAQMNLQTQLKA